MSFSELANIKVGNYSVGSLCSAGVTLLVALLVIQLLIRLIRRLLRSTKLDVRVQKYVLYGTRLVLYTVAILIVMDTLGIPITSLVALVSVGGLAISLAAQSLLANVAGGLVILSAHPFNLGDLIENDGVVGTVYEITLNYTRIHTLDGQEVVLPNKELSTSKIANYTKLGRRRIAHKISASYDASTETVKGACRKALSRTERLLETPAPEVYLSAYGDSAIEYSVYAWARPEDYWEARFALLEQIRIAFDEAGVEMTYDHLNVHLVEDRTHPGA